MSAISFDQASRLRDLVDSHDQSALPTSVAAPVVARTARVIAIASGKGGVGKTNIAVNLAVCLAQLGQRVVLVDADLGTANVDLLLNVRAPFDLSHVISGRCTLEKAMERVRPGLHVIAGASGLSHIADLDPAQRRALVSQLTRLERECDIMLMDCGAGISQNVLAFACAADELLVVTTPEPPAMTDAYALLKAVSRQSRFPPISLIVNQTKRYREGIRVGGRVASVAARFLGTAVTQAGQIPRDEHVELAVRRRSTVTGLFPRSPAAQALSMLAKRVENHATGLGGYPGFFHRVARFFC